MGQPRARLAILAGVLAAGAVVALLVGPPSQVELEATVDDAGLAAPLVYAVLYVALTVALVPGTLLTAAGGAIFGVALGTALTVVSATIAATVSFVLGRRLGRAQVEQLAAGRAATLDAWIRRNGFLAILYVRLVPLVPFNVLNYVAGVSSVPLRTYVAATAVGIVPGSFAYSALGSSLDDPASPEFVAAVALVVVLAVAAPVVGRVRRPR